MHTYICVDACVSVNMYVQMSVKTRGQPQLLFLDTIYLASFLFRHCSTLTWTLACRLSLLARELQKAKHLQLYISGIASICYHHLLLIYVDSEGTNSDPHIRKKESLWSLNADILNEW